MRLGLDYAGGRPDPTAIAAAGYSFVVRYLSDGGSSLPGKLLTPEEADRLRAAGVDIVGNWETTAKRMLEGYAAGEHDAYAALSQVQLCSGNEAAPIYFSADWDATPEEQHQINAYLQACGDVLGGPSHVGIYGGYWPCTRAAEAELVGYVWQTGAWSGDNIYDSMNLYQRIGYVWVDGVQCDVNEARTENFGQWSWTEEAPVAQDNDKLIQEIWEQVRQPWPQLGQNAAGENLTLVDAVAAMKTAQEAEIVAATNFRDEVRTWMDQQGAK